MGVMSVVQWWEESQMRVLVLGSLVAQSLLFIFTFIRRRAIPCWIRFLMWLAYLGGDAIAIYALATLFNRHKDQDREGKSMLEVVWAPILLLHLGGPDGITAYNIEDNELWSRHLFTAVSQVMVAIYVFWKSWRPGSDKRLLQVSILLFIAGVLKCFTKPFALKRASITSLVSSPAAKRTAKKTLDKYVKQAKAFVQEQKDEVYVAQGEACEEKVDHCPPQRAKQNEDEMDPFEEYVKRARYFVVGEQKDEQGERAPVEDTEPTRRRREITRRERILRLEVYKLFVDLSSPYPAGHRLSIFKYFWVLINQEKAEKTTTRNSKQEEDDTPRYGNLYPGLRLGIFKYLGLRCKEKAAETSYSYVRRGLGSAFLLLYTKLKTAGIWTDADLEARHSPAVVIGVFCRYWLWVSRMVLPLAATAVFAYSHSAAYDKTDVKITYTLLWGTVILDAYSVIPLMFMNDDEDGIFCCNHPLIITREQWPETVAQYSLMSYFARNKNHAKLMWIASNFGCKDMVDQRWCMEPCLSSRGITDLVLQYLKAGWEKKIQDVASYRSFIDNRGHWALEGNEQRLSWSIKEPFDESVLLWHIATDFCFFSSPFSQHVRVCGFAKVPSIRQSLLDFAKSCICLGGATKTSESKCDQRLAECKAVQCRQMSNYMVYLLFVNPEMLLPGTRRNLFRAANDELKDILVGDNKLNTQSSCHCQEVEEKDVMMSLIKEMQDRSKIQDNASEEGSKQEGQPNGENFINDTWVLAQGLLKLREDFGEEKMWEVIQGVWVEMLCFSASRCRGYLHAKALGSGGEFLSYVWLLLFYMGMETFTERMQREREELLSQEANNDTAPAPWASDSHKDNVMTSSTSLIRSRGVSTPSHIHTGESTSNSDEIQMANMV